ncbi:MAG: hypothetical protein JSS02_23380 [Planctomycetes bacterium]|nr:hypothetical protein [Planctomycetota bacterium]
MSVEGYARLVAAGQALTGTEMFENRESPTPERMAEFLEANRAALENARQALAAGCRVPVVYDSSYSTAQSDNLQALRNLVRTFACELLLAKQRGDHWRVVQIGLEIFQMGNAGRSGGLLIDMLSALAVESMSFPALRSVREHLTPTESRKLANSLLELDEAREPFEDIKRRDQHWEQVVYPERAQATGHPLEGIDFDAIQPKNDEERQMLQMARAAMAMPPEQLDLMQQLSDLRHLVAWRLLALELGIQAFHADRGTYPDRLEDLVPEFLTRLPTDPLADQSFCYQKTDDGYRLYSPGPTRQDHGGQGGGWFDVISGNADLTLESLGTC